MLRQLVLIALGTTTPKSLEMGYLDSTGTLLVHPQGSIKIKADQFRIAHPQWFVHDSRMAFVAGNCFSAERQQPFKQVFRELYVLTKTEATERGSKRYEGHQINPQQAMALFGPRAGFLLPTRILARTFTEKV